VKSFLEKLHAAAEAQGRAEIAYRDESRRRLEELAALRTRAYRRYNLLNDMADLAQTQNEQEESVRLQTALAAQETGWAESADGYADVCERLAAVASHVHAEVHDNGTEGGRRVAPERTVDEIFTEFEAWHRERFGDEFLDRMRREAPFYPVVDF